MDRPQVLHLFGRQYGVASVEQLITIGMSASTIARARRRGALITVLPGVVSLAGFPSTFESRAMALVRWRGDCFLSGTTAAALYGLRSMPRTRLELTVPEACRRRVPSWARLVRTSWSDEVDVVLRPDGLRIASPLRMLFGLAGQFNEHRFERAAEDAWHLGLVAPTDAASYLATVRRSGRGGVVRFEQWLIKTGDRARPSQSGLELDFVDLIRRTGLPEPTRQHPLVLMSGETVHVDLAWPEARLGVEPGHSWWHGGDLRMRVDMARDRACDEIGWRIVRYDETERQNPGLGQQLANIYRQRRRQFSGALVVMDDTHGGSEPAAVLRSVSGHR